MTDSVYLLFLCDSWKSTDSFRLCGCTDSFDEVKTAAQKLLGSRTIENKLEDWNPADAKDHIDLNNILEYFYVSKVVLGEILTDGGTIV